MQCEDWRNLKLHRKLELAHHCVQNIIFSYQVHNWPIEADQKTHKSTINISPSADVAKRCTQPFVLYEAIAFVSVILTFTFQNQLCHSTELCTIQVVCLFEAQLFNHCVILQVHPFQYNQINYRICERCLIELRYTVSYIFTIDDWGAYHEPHFAYHDTIA